MEKDIFLQNLPLGKPVFAWLPCQLRLRFYFCYIIRPHSMNQDQCFLDLLATFIGSLKSSYIICLDLLKFLRLGNKCWKRCTLQYRTSHQLPCRRFSMFVSVEYFHCDAIFC